jgi:hypothetical protein
MLGLDRGTSGVLISDCPFIERGAGIAAPQKQIKEHESISAPPQRCQRNVSDAATCCKVAKRGVEIRGRAHIRKKERKKSPRNRVRRSGSASAGNQTPVREPVRFDSSENYILPAQSHRSSLKIIPLFAISCSEQQAESRKPQPETDAISSPRRRSSATSGQYPLLLGLNYTSIFTVTVDRR